MERISRRAFLGGSVLAIAGLATWWLTRSHVQDLIVRILQRNLDYLILDEDDLWRFADDFVANQDIMDTPKVRLVSLVNPIYSVVPDSTLDNFAAARSIEDVVTTSFLLSSDFFWNGEDESQPVRYVAYYQPGRVACLNPFNPLGTA